MANNKHRANSMERSLARDLSLWWSGGASDDVFYRSDSSGARATARARRGKSTRYQYGDIGVRDPSGEPLLRLAVVECKKGYPRCSLGDFLDRGLLARQELESWVLKADADARAAGSESWIIVHHRGGRRARVALFPDTLADRINYDPFAHPPACKLVFRVKTRPGRRRAYTLYATTLANLLKIPPERFGKIT